MEKNYRFRNHISIIFEKTVRIIGVIVFIFVGNFITSMDEMDDMGSHTLYLVLVLGAFLAVLFLWQIFVWAKTYISIEENMLIVERNTLNRKKNSIGLKNISNVNLEQNVFEMLIGTCKVKLDTNTLSTADQTDVNIVLKKRDAEKFRQIILNEATPGEKQERVIEETEERKFRAAMDDIVMHGLFSVNFLSLLMLAGVVFGVIVSLSELGLEDVSGDGLEMLLSILVSIWILGGLLWNVIKGFVKYIDFKIERRGDKIFLNYGVLKKVAYSIPVDKINAVKFTQTAFARLGKRCMVEIVNVGIDDDNENEANSFLLPYAKTEVVAERMRMILPEFADCIEIKEEKQPKSIWLIWLPAVLIYLTLAVATWGILEELFPEAKIVFLIGFGIISVLLLISKFFSYLTVGVGVNDRFVKIVCGSFARRMICIRHDKIQYVTTKQNFVAKYFGVQKGAIHLLASMKNQIQEFPYCKEELAERLKTFLL